MEFQNALVAIKKGYKVQRKSIRNRLNAVCIYLEGNELVSEQTHPLSEHKKNTLSNITTKSLLATDWIAYKE